MKLDFEPMEESEMNSELRQWKGSRSYNAALQYASKRKDIALDGLRSVDPFRNPTEIARTQGIPMGLFDLFDYIELLLAKEAKAQEESPK